ncbi:MAG: malectin domain-containing carbohydrate-binding protein, partial [Candidatus Marinimicrobia bacterium]|nr:malectin domain-containing carbohydrate-binding protein [Candidatus Neomarinimicrobiota bacterium]
DQNFTPVWLDDFDEYDPIRWEKSDGWSWNGNNALLVAENVVYEEGQMILCLTLPGEEGRVDIHPPHALWARAHYPDSVVVQFSEELDPLTAETLSTYAITGAPILAVTLQPDQRTVSLKVQNLSFSGSAVLYAFGIQDLADPVNTQVNTSVSINMPAPLDLPINIDCGGPGAQAFLADQVWSESVEYGHEGGGNQIATWYPDLADTDLDSVMATSLNRFSRYHVRLNQGIFDIQLHFAEHYYDETGERVFQLYVEDSLIVAELDVFNVVGNTSVFSVNLPGFEICDGSLDILGSALNYGEGYAYAGPVLNAIQINGEYWVNVDSNVKPEHYQFNHFYPNPFNSQAHFDFTIPESAWVDIFLYDVRGSLVRELVSQNYYPGGYQLAIDGKDLASGTYIVRLESQNFIKSRKILLLK